MVIVGNEELRVTSSQVALKRIALEEPKRDRRDLTFKLFALS